MSVHLHSTRVTLSGGVVIDMTGIDETEPAQWADLHCAIDGDHVIVYKAVRPDLRSQHGTEYPIGATVTCDDWRDDNDCGGGLHVSPHPWQAGEYDSQASRFLECRVPVAALRPIDGNKCKAPAVLVVREVDVHGEPLVVSS